MKIAVLIALGLLFSGWATAEEREHPFKAVHVIENTESPTVAVYLVLGLPRANEEMVPGMAHYVEHLVWLSIANDSNKNVDQHSNAWTNPLTMGYWLSGDPIDFDNMLSTLGGIFEPFTVSLDFARQERNIVLREYDFRLSNNVDGEAQRAISEFVYQGNQIGDSVIGSKEDIASFDMDLARKYQQLTHQPENTTVVVIGNIDKKTVLNSLAKKFGDWQSLQPSVIKLPVFNLASLETRSFTFNEDNVSPRLIWHKVIPLEKPQPFDLLSLRAIQLTSILNTSLPGGLAGPLRFDEFIASEFGFTINALDEQHIELRFEALADTGVSLQDVLQAFEQALAKSMQGVPDETYDRTTQRFANFWPDWEDEDEKANWSANYVLQRVPSLRQPQAIADLKALNEELSQQAVNDMLKMLERPGRIAIAYIEPPKGDEQ